VTDANGVTITSTFDDLGRLRTRTYPDTGVERFGYTVKGLVAYTNQISKVTLYDYDAALRKVAETNANLEVVRYQYKPSGDLWKLTDGKSQVTTWLYDQYGRVTNKVDQASVEILRYAYDANSRLTNRWSKAKLNTKYKYDAVGNLTNVDYNVSPDIRLAYDALNRLTNMVDAAGTTAYKYYAGGLLWTEDGPWASDTVTNYYNTARMRSGLGLAQPTGAWTNGFTYDGGHRLATVISPAGTFTYTYKGPGNLVTNLALPNTSQITNAFDSVGRLTSTRLLTSTSLVLNAHAYIYNLASQRTNQARTDASTVTYAYDNIGQLKSAVGSGGQSTENLGYLYDTAWNLNERTNNGTPTTFAVNVKNELTSGPNGTCSYDYNGNLSSESSGPVRTFTYDDENQLTAVVWGTGSYRTEFTYDGRGRMRKRLEKYYSGGQWTATSTNYYVYDGMRVIQERNSSNVPAVGYTRGNDLSGGRICDLFTKVLDYPLPPR
jgi:YD repeat-containing protein